MKDLWKNYLKDITPYKPGKPIDEVKRELGLGEVVKLASNENPMPPSPKVLKAIEEAAKEVNRYPDGGCFYLRKALSERLGVHANNLIFGNGSDELIVLALRASVNPRDEVIVANPTFMIYHIASMVEGAKLNVIPLKDFRYDLEAMHKAINKETKLIFIANPDNPTGSYVKRDELDSFIDNIPPGVIVFMDEAYYEYATGGDYPETLDLIKRVDKNVIVARTFSKAYALAGLRVGYAAAREDIIESLNKVREPFNVNSIAQAAAIAALKDEDYMKRSVSHVRDEKERFYAFFNETGISFIPSRTNFILFNTGMDSKKVFGDLLKEGVIVREMSEWRLEGFIRVNIGLKEENNKFFAALRKILAFGK